MSAARPALDRFAEKVALTDAGCIEWIASTNGGGYGTFYPGNSGASVVAHRWSYEYHVGPIPDGLYLDHLCRNRACVNPDHLEPVTQRENLMRSDSPSARAARKTHCPQGHPYANANVFIDAGKRKCRTCVRTRNREASRRRRNQKAS